MLRKTFKLYSPFTLFSLVRKLRKNPVDTLSQMFHDKNGSYDALTLDGKLGRVHILGHPDHIHEFLKNPQRYQRPPAFQKIISVFGRTSIFTSPYDRWKKQRRAAIKYFADGRSKQYESHIREQAQQMVQKWKSGKTKDLYEDCRDFAMQSFFSSLFGADISKDKDDIKKHIATVNKHVMLTLLNPLALLRGKNFYKPRSVKKAQKYLKNFLGEMCKKQLEAASQIEDNLISEMLHANGYYSAANAEQKEEARIQTFEEIIHLFAAGYESTASSLTWLTYRLANQPALQDNIQKECAAILKGATPDTKNLRTLGYLNGIISETVRINPSLYASIPRQATEDIELEEGHTISKGDFVVIPIMNVNTDPRWHGEAEKFEPARGCPFSHLAKTGGSDLSFLTGAQKCIGKDFFYTEAGIFVTELLKELTPQPTNKIPPLTFRTNISPKNGYGMEFKPRDVKPAPKPNSDTSPS